MDRDERNAIAPLVLTCPSLIIFSLSEASWSGCVPLKNLGHRYIVYVTMWRTGHNKMFLVRYS